MSEIWARITHYLDQVAMRSPSNIAWDIFVWPDTNKDHWGEDCLPYSPGSTVDLSSQMLGIWLVLHDEMGQCKGVARVLKYEGHMLVYDPQTNGTGWVPMRGIPSLLTNVESRSVSDLGNFYPIHCTVVGGMTPHGENQQAEYSHAGIQASEFPLREFDADWDTDDAQDRSLTPSPVVIVDEPTQGATGKTSSMGHSRCLVPEHMLEAETKLHRESAPKKVEEEKTDTQKGENTPRAERSTPVTEDDVVILHAGQKIYNDCFPKDTLSSDS